MQGDKTLGALSEWSEKNDVVQIRARTWCTGLLAGILFTWALILFGGPIYMADSVAYYKGGNAAVEFATNKFNELSESSAVSVPRSINGEKLKADGHVIPEPAAQVAEATGVRSIAYSLIAYLLGAPSGTMVLLAIAQGLLVGLIFALFLETFAVQTYRSGTVAALVLATCTPLSFVCMFVAPDIFTGLLIVTLLALGVAVERMSIALRLLFVASAALAVSTHASHPPLAAVVTLVCIISRIYRGDRRIAHLVWLIAPLALGMAGTLVANRVGFGETSLVAKRYPLTLARSISDGPARWYLERHCDEIKYTVCEVFPERIPSDINNFLFSSEGLENRATPAQMDAIRSEEATIVLAAAREYPLAELSRLTRNFLRQLVGVQPYLQFNQTLEFNAVGVPALVTHSDSSVPRWTTWIEPISLIAAACSLLWLKSHWNKLDIVGRHATLILLVALLANAAICVFFSGVAGRYQARVIWVLPLLAFALHRRSTNAEN